MLDDVLDEIADLGTEWLAAIAFFLPFGQTVAFLDLLVPGEVGLVFLGSAAQSAPRLALVYTFGMLGAFCGDSVSWFVGHRWGAAILTRWPRLRRRVEPAMDRAAAHFDRHGGRSIFVARFIGALRAMAPLVAGTAGLPYRVFAPWNAAASVCWVGLVVTIGAIAGEAVASSVERVSATVSILVVVGLLVWWARRRASG